MDRRFTRICQLHVLAGASICALVQLEPFVDVAHSQPVECGNGVVDAGEDCDDSDAAFTNGEPCTGACAISACGKPTASAGQRPLASDALFTLGSAVGARTCDPCVCDIDASGTTTATDALSILKAAVGQPITLSCFTCAAVTRHGQLLVQPVIDVPASARDGLVQRREEIEAGGLTLTADGSGILWPVAGAAGWLVTIGEQQTFADADGNFTINVPQGIASGGTIAHPQEPGTALFGFSLGLLSRTGAGAVPLTFELNFKGPCGMNDDPAIPDPEACVDLLASLRRGDGHHHDHHHGNEYGRADASANKLRDGDTPLGAARSITDPAQAQTNGPLGTYPAGNQHCCRDFDGLGGDPTTLIGTLTSYVGSTCDEYVGSGCCAGELGSIKNSALSALGLLTPVSCLANHKGRYCQEVAQYEVAVQVDSNVAIPLSSVTETIRLGETQPVTVHNNGCFGETSVVVIVQTLLGVLTGDGYDGKTVRHYSGPKTYVADRPLTYAVAPCTGEFEGTPRDTYWFSTDGVTAAVVFELATDNLWKFVPDGPIFSAHNRTISGPDACSGQHVHGPHPCTGAPDPNPGECGHGIVVPYTP